MKQNLIETVVNYINLSPIVLVQFNNDNEFRELKTFNDKKMRKSLATNIGNGSLPFFEMNDNVITFKTENELPIEIKSGIRGEYSAPIFVRNVVIPTNEVQKFSSAPKEVQRTAKEQADYLFGQLISEVGGEEWINEQTWIARNKDIIHNNNKGNVAYTRLRIMLKRCFNIYNNFSKTTTKNNKAKKNNV